MKGKDMNVRQQRIKMKRVRSSQRGMSLIELMIAIGLGLFLTWGAIQAFLTGKQTYSMQQGLSRLQENARMAQEFIGFDLRGAGSLGGASGSFIGGRPADPGCGNTCGASGTAACTGVSMLLATARVRAEYNFANPVFGADDVPATSNPTNLNLLTPLNPVPIAGTDVLVVHTTTDLGLTAINFTPNTNNSPGNKNQQQTGATTYNNQGLAVGDIVALSDFTRTKIFQINNITPSGANMVLTWSNGGSASSPVPRPGNAISSSCPGGSWSESYRFGWGINATTGVDYYSPETTLKRLDTSIYYVATNPVTNEPALYRRLLGQINSLALLDGVENMQLDFGVDIDNDLIIDEWRTANNVTAAQWSTWDDLTDTNPLNPQQVSDLKNSLRKNPKQQNVVAVRYSLLLRSQQELLEAPQSYTYNGTPVVAPDRRFRQVVTSTIGIRSTTN